MDLWEGLKRHLAQLSQSETIPGSLPQSSVLALVGQNNDTGCDEILLMKRTMTVDTHKGQVCFPGGYHEPSDADLLQTALRETYEEIGVVPEEIEVLGKLRITTTRQSVQISPFVGRMHFPYPFKLSSAEVERVFFLSVDQLIKEGLRQVVVPVGDFRVHSIGIEVDGELVWGATARMLEELRDHLIRVRETPSQ